MRALAIILLLAIACLAGLITSELFWRSPAAREVIGRFTGRGELRALVGGIGIYADADTEAEAQIVAENLRRFARDEAIAEADVEREMNLLRYQFPNEQAFAKAVEAASSSEPALRRDVSEHLRGRQWIEKQVATALAVSEDECRQFYEQNRAEFMQPQRFRASHLFLAAPGETPPEVVDAKHKAIKAFTARLTKREPLTTLVAEASEDEATKPHGGDLGIFSAARVPPEFVTEITKLRVGQMSPVIRTHLGFHLVQLTDMKPPRELSFDEARPEIQQRLLNAKRAAAVAKVAERLAVAEFRRSSGR